MTPRKQYRERVWPHGLITTIANRLGYSISHVSEALGGHHERPTPSAAKCIAVAKRADALLEKHRSMLISEAVDKAIKSLKLKTDARSL